MSEPADWPRDLEYVGFWARTGAAVIDSILMLLIIVPAIYWIYGPQYFETPEAIAGPADVLLNWVFPAIAVILFWVYRQATPGKMVVGARIVDAITAQPPSKGQLIGRYVGYYVSMIPLLLGIIWIAFDARKQGWHDKLAGTVVVRRRR